MLDFLTKYGSLLYVIILIILMAIFQYFIDKPKKKKLLVVSVYIIVLIISIITIPNLQEKYKESSDYLKFKPNIGLTINKVDSEILDTYKKMYDISNGENLYFVKIDNIGEKIIVKDINLELYFNGDVQDKKIIFQKDASEIKQDEVILAVMLQDNKTISYKSHLIKINSLNPGGSVASIIGIDLNKEATNQSYDLSWKWHLNNNEYFEKTSGTFD